MLSYVVLYRDADDPPDDDPLAFTCEADDAPHAEEQCRDAYPGCDVVWTEQAFSVETVFQHYLDRTRVDRY